MTQEKILALFREKGFRATPQRIAVFNYVYEHRDHPDVLAIYENVLKSNPGFSKTTVYNALKSLCESGFITAITIDGGRIHYDANVNFHGHFICKHCGEIYDFQLEEPVSTLPKGFIVQKKMYITAAFAQAVTIKNNYYFEGVIYYEQKVLLPGMRLHK